MSLQMKNTLKILLLVFVLFFISTNLWFSYTEGSTISKNLNDLLEKTSLVNPDDMSFNKWFKNFTDNILNRISVLLWFAAVFWIAFWWFKMVISAWEEDKITSAKNIIKWSIIWFVWIITATLIINIVIRIMYSL